MTYAQHFQTRATPQTEPADQRQVENSAGGFSFAVDKWAQLERFLILGAEGGSYYATERKLVRDNAKSVQACLDEDPVRAVHVIAEISKAGRAPKNDAAVFALALAAGHPNEAARREALAALPEVCRIGTHLFQFVEAVQGFRGWGRGLRRGVAGWYNALSTEKLAYQVAKYQQRNGFSHRDVLRLAHPEQTPDRAAIYRWVTGAELGDRSVKRGDAVTGYGAVGELPPILAAMEELKTATDPMRVVTLIRELNLTHEMIPGEWKSRAVVWEALSERMPLGALIRNLAKLTAVGVIAPLSSRASVIASRLTDTDGLRMARVHPIALLSALKVYGQGHGEKGKLTWSPVPVITDALNEAFYLSFNAIEPTGKNILLALDVSGSMNGGQLAGVPGLTPRMGAATMAMVTARTEKNWHVMGFSGGFVPLSITPQQRLDDVIRYMDRLPFDRTDCSLPMKWAMVNKAEVDAFAVYTDNETYAGTPHPHQALQQYRRQQGKPRAKLAVVGMVANPFTIADPSDPGMLDFVGFDAAAPAVMADFFRS